MDKMPCHITDEVIANGPQDAPDAVDKDYEVIITIVANVIITVSAENELEAIAEAKEQADWSNVNDIDWKTEDAEVIEQ